MDKFNELYNKIIIKESDLLIEPEENKGYDNFDDTIPILESELLDNNDIEIINESKLVFRYDDFKNLIDVILNLNENDYLDFRRKDLVDYIKNTGDWTKPYKHLLIFKYDFNDVNTLFDFFENKLLLNRNNKRLQNLANNLKSNVPGVYFKFSELYGIIILNSSVINTDCIYHELIHFVQDVTGKGVLLDAEERKTDKFEPIELLAKAKKLDTYTLINGELTKKIIREEEIIPYFNNICYKLIPSAKYNKNLPLQIMNELMVFAKEWKKRDGHINELISAINQHSVFITLGLGERACLTICLATNQHFRLIKKLVGNYFKDMKEKK